MDYIEETTPRGITIKVTPKKWNFLVFDQRGGSVYADKAGSKILHQVPLIAFVGENFRLKNTANPEFSFLKVVKNRIVVPYLDTADNKRKYIFVETESTIDLLPVRLKELRDVAALVREIEAGVRPDSIVVNKNITKNDIIIIKNRFADARIMLADRDVKEEEAAKERAGINQFAEVRATEVIKDVNINMMSTNPVFLARVHLREMNLSKVNQLILDFDLSALEAEYILSFIDTMLTKTESDAEIKKNVPKLQSLHDSLQFYVYLLRRDEEKIRQIISSIGDTSILASFSTLVAKVKLLYPGTDDQLIFTDYENIIWEKKSQGG